MKEAPPSQPYMVRCTRTQAEVWKVEAANEGEAQGQVELALGRRLESSGDELSNITVLPITVEDRLTECGNCCSIWLEGELKEPQDLWQRVEPGEAVPAGECPECGALAHLLVMVADRPPPLAGSVPAASDPPLLPHSVQYDCRPGDVIRCRSYPHWQGRVLNTYPGLVDLEVDGVSISITYDELKCMGAVYVAKLIPLSPDGRLLAG